VLFCSIFDNVAVRLAVFRHSVASECNRTIGQTILVLVLVPHWQKKGLFSFRDERRKAYAKMQNISQRGRAFERRAFACDEIAVSVSDIINAAAGRGCHKSGAASELAY